MNHKIFKLFVVSCFCLLAFAPGQVNNHQSLLNWGYGYNDLLADLGTWGDSPWVAIDSIGASVQNRTLWELTITDTTPAAAPRRTVYIHARTHPNEIESFWVTDEMIKFLISDDAFAGFIRSNCVFYIIPMFNPDGVELGYGRENANGIDVESNWANNPMEPEPAALKQRFTALMNSTAPIEVALNMHSASSATKRYFVFHHENGTSTEYATLEKQFIAGVQSYFPTGIADWDYFVSWSSSTPNYYPESWFWLNHGANVMSLTYEDMRNNNAAHFDSSAYALLHGITDYLGLAYSNVEQDLALQPDQIELYQNYPNPFNASTTITYLLNTTTDVELSIIDITGRRLATLIDAKQTPGLKTVQWRADRYPTGVYFYQLITPSAIEVRKLTLIK